MIKIKKFLSCLLSKDAFDLLASIGVALIYSVAAIGLLALISGHILNSKPDISNAEALSLLFLPFLGTLILEYAISRTMFRTQLTKKLSDTKADMIFEGFSEFLTVLITVCIAFLLFLKPSTYDLVELKKEQKFTDDVLISWIVSTITVLRLTFDSAIVIRRKQQDAVQQKAITEQRRSQRIIVYPKRIYNNRSCCQTTPHFQARALFKNFRKNEKFNY